MPSHSSARARAGRSRRGGGGGAACALMWDVRACTPHLAALARSRARRARRLRAHTPSPARARAGRGRGAWRGGSCARAHTGRARVLASPASLSSCRLFSLAIAIAMVRALVRAVPPGWRHDLLSLALCDACRSEKGTCWHEVFTLARSLIREPQVVPTDGLGRILLPKPVI